MAAAAAAGNSFFLTMRGGADPAVSISGLFFVTALPFLFTAFAVSFSQPRLLLLLAFLKAFSFGYCAFGIMTVYSGAAWLVQFLLMFSDGCSLPLLMWLWLHHTGQPGTHFFRDLVFCLIAVTVIGIIDICLVSPFTAMLI